MRKIKNHIRCTERGPVKDEQIKCSHCLSISSKRKQQYCFWVGICLSAHPQQHLGCQNFLRLAVINLQTLYATEARLHNWFFVSFDHFGLIMLKVKNDNIQKIY